MIQLLMLAVITIAMLAVDILLVRHLARNASRNATSPKDVLRHRTLRTMVR